MQAFWFRYYVNITQSSSSPNAGCRMSRSLRCSRFPSDLAKAKLRTDIFDRTLRQVSAFPDLQGCVFVIRALCYGVCVSPQGCPKCEIAEELKSSCRLRHTECEATNPRFNDRLGTHRHTKIEICSLKIHNAPPRAFLREAGTG